MPGVQVQFYIIKQIFTKLAHWADSVLQSQCPYMYIYMSPRAWGPMCRKYVIKSQHKVVFQIVSKLFLTNNFFYVSFVSFVLMQPTKRSVKEITQQMQTKKCNKIQKKAISVKPDLQCCHLIPYIFIKKIHLVY